MGREGALWEAPAEPKDLEDLRMTVREATEPAVTTLRGRRAEGRQKGSWSEETGGSVLQWKYLSAREVCENEIVRVGPPG